MTSVRLKQRTARETSLVQRILAGENITVGLEGLRRTHLHVYTRDQDVAQAIFSDSQQAPAILDDLEQIKHYFFGAYCVNIPRPLYPLFTHTISTKQGPTHLNKQRVLSHAIELYWPTR